MDAKDLKRKIVSPGDDIPKIIKYSSLIPLIRDLECNEKSKKMVESLLKLNDVDYFDPNESDSTPLCYALKCREHDWIKFLLEKGANPALATVELENQSVQTVPDFLWSKKDYETTIKVLLADSPFPREYEEHKLRFGLRLKPLSIIRFSTFQRRYQGLRESIKEGNIEAIETFAESNRMIRHAYDDKNQCALTFALELKSFKIYSLLRLKGFAKGVDQKHDEIMKSLSPKEKKILNLEIRKYFKSTDIHILNLLSKSYIGLNNEYTCLDKIKEYYEALNSIEDMVPILEIAASENALNIIFDFNRDDIEDLDPTNDFSNNYSVNGRTFKNGKKILIAAGRDRSDLLGTLAQELTHFALNILYDNEHRPYDKNNEKRKSLYTTVIGACHEMCNRDISSREEIIESAFAYEKEHWEAELISRVPQLLVVYEKDKKRLEKIAETFKELFEFFRAQVLKDIKQEIIISKNKKKVQELNNMFGVFSFFIFYTIKTTINCWEKFEKELCAMIPKKRHVLVATKTPELVLATAIQALALKNSENVFIKLNQLMTSNSFFQDVLIMNTTLKLFIIDSIDVEDKACVDLLGTVTNDFDVVFISSRNFEKSEKMFQKHQLNFNWNDLTEKSQNTILNYKVSIQELQYRLIELFGKNVEKLMVLPLNELLEIQKYKFNDFEMLRSKASKYIPRFFKESLSNDTFKEDGVLARLDLGKTVLLADIAGMGKSTSAIKFVEMLTLSDRPFWVVFLDLKQHINNFSLNQKKKLSKSEFLKTLESILNFKIETEKSLFNLFWENKKSIFIIDGFDEISPLFKEFVLKLILHVQSSGNQLLVTTRMHLKKELEEKLKLKALNLLPFTEQDQITFIIESLNHESKIKAPKLLPLTEPNQIDSKIKSLREKSKDKTITELEQVMLTQLKLEAKARKILKKFVATSNKKQIFLKIPLQLFMFSNIFGVRNFTKKELNISTLYMHFIDSKMNIWMDKGKLATDENKEIHSSQFTVSQIHQSLAIKMFYEETICDSMQIRKHPINGELICRIGLMQFSLNGELLFNHETFADFFVAQFLMRSLTTQKYEKTFEVMHRLLVKVIVENNYYYESIRNFINAMLIAEDEIFHKDMFAETVAPVLTVQSNRIFLINLIEAKHFHLLKFLLVELGLDMETKLDIIKHKNTSDYNALFVAACDVDSWINLWECIQSSTKRITRKELLLIEGGPEKKTILDRSKTQKTKIQNMILNTYRELWNSKTRIKGFSVFEHKKSHSGQKTSEKKLLKDKPSAFEILWKSVEENFDVQFQKNLLFGSNESSALFYDLLDNQSSLKTVLKTIKKLFIPNDLNTFLLTDNFISKIQQRYASKSQVMKKIEKFLQNTLKNVEEGAIIKDFLNIDVIGENSEELSEKCIFNRTLFCVDSLIKSQNISMNGSYQNVEWLLQIIVQLTIYSNQEFYSIIWEFIEQRVAVEKQKKLLLLKHESHNTLTGVLKNKNKTLLHYVYAKLIPLFKEQDFQDSLRSSRDNWVVEVFVQYARSADLEAFQIFWSLFEEKEDAFKKCILLKKQRKGANALSSSSENKNLATIKLIFSIAEKMLGPEDFLVDGRSPGNRWVYRTIKEYGKNAEKNAFEIFWSFFKNDIEQNDVKVMMKACAENKSRATVKYMISIVSDLIQKKENFFVSETDKRSWAIEVAASFAGKANLENFKSFWTFIEKTFCEEDRKLILISMKENEHNMLISCVHNEDKLTIGFIFEKATHLFKDFIFTNQSWILKTLKCYVRVARLEAFKSFWSFLLSKIDFITVSTLLTSNKNIALLSCSKNRDKKTVLFIFNEVRGIFAQALITETLNKFALHAECETFVAVFQFFKEKFEHLDLKSMFLKINEKGHSVFRSSIKNKDKNTIELIFDIASKFLTEEGSSTELLDPQNWIFKTCSRYCAFSKLSAFQIFWKFIEKTFNADEQKKLLWKTQAGPNVLKSMAKNKDVSTIKEVFEILKKLISEDDVSEALNGSNNNLWVNLFCRYALRAKIDAFAIFWSFSEEYLEEEDQKLVLLQKNSNGLNALMYSAKNKDKETVKKVLEIAKSLVTEKDITADIELGDEGWVVNSLNKFAMQANIELFNLFWSILKEKTEKKIRKAIFLQRKNIYGHNVIGSSAKNKDQKTSRKVLNIAERLLNSDDFILDSKKGSDGWIVECLNMYAVYAGKELFVKFYDLVFDNLKDEIATKSIFLQKDLDGQNVLMSSAENDDESTIGFIFDKAQTFLFPDKAINDIAFLNTDWIIALCIQHATLADVKGFKIVWTFLKTNLLNKVLKSVLLIQDDNGYNALMSAAENKNKSTTKLVLEIVEEFLSIEEYRDYRFFVYWFNRHHKDFIQFDIMFDEVELRNYLLKDYFSYNLIFAITFIGDAENNQVLWNLLLKYLHPIEIKTKLLAKDKDDYNAFHNALLNNRPIVMTFLAWFKDNFSSNLKTLFEKLTNKSETLMHLLASDCDEILWKEFFDFIDPLFTESEIDAMLVSEDKSGQTPFHLSEKNNKNKIRLQEFISEFRLNREQSQNLFSK